MIFVFPAYVLFRTTNPKQLSLFSQIKLSQWFRLLCSRKQMEDWELGQMCFSSSETTNDCALFKLFCRAQLCHDSVKVGVFWPSQFQVIHLKQILVRPFWQFAPFTVQPRIAKPLWMREFDVLTHVVVSRAQSGDVPQDVVEFLCLFIHLFLFHFYFQLPLVMAYSLLVKLPLHGACPPLPTCLVWRRKTKVTTPTSRSFPKTAQDGQASRNKQTQRGEGCSSFWRSYIASWYFL